MGLNDTPSAERKHIGFFGMRNAGKSSVVNAVTGQDLSLVSDVKGTTTDPVKKAMELLPFGPVVIIDTPGLDDKGELGQMRVKRAYKELNYTDLAVLVIDATVGKTEADLLLSRLCAEKGIPCLTVYNKCDLPSATQAENSPGVFCVSAKTGEGISSLKDAMAAALNTGEISRPLVSDLLTEGDTVVLVVPIDEGAPKGRLILPQQQTIRDILECGCSALVTRDTDLKSTMKKLSAPPRLVITDSQVFGPVAKMLPPDQPLTSFSILFARYKGNLEQAVRGAAVIDRLKDGDRVLISEGCSHHRQCGDIGSVKLPARIRQKCGASPTFEFTSGKDFPEDLSPYRLIVHCGGCMLTAREMQYRARCAADAGIPMTNYGLALAHAAGILQRSLLPLPGMSSILEEKG